MRTNLTSLRIILSYALIFARISLGIGVCGVCYSQNIDGGDSLAYQLLLKSFDEEVGLENMPIVNGTKYTVPLQVSGSHPFYNSASGSIGNITFAQQLYFNLTLFYDVYSDEVILQQRRASGMHALIKLYKANVDSFRIFDHIFKNYQDTTAQKLGVVSGFYDVLYEHTAFSVIVKRKKTTYVEANGLVQYKNEDQYFFIEKGRAAPFRGMKNFNQVLVDKDLISELRAFVNKNDLEVKENDKDLIAVARKCDAILNKQK